MKRSKLFLVATSCLLAITGVAAAKAHRFGSIRARYFSAEDGPIGKCETFIFDNMPATSIKIGPSIVYRWNLGVPTNPLYTFYTVTRNCVQVLYTKAQ